MERNLAAACAASLNSRLSRSTNAKAGAFGALQIDTKQSGTVSAWLRRDGGVRLLAGNLEEGLRDDADRSRHMTLSLPQAWRACRWRSDGRVPAPAAGATQARIDLPPQGSALWLCER